MRQLKRRLAYALVFAMVLGMMSPGMMVAKAAVTSLAGVTVDYGKEVINIVSGGAIVSYSYFKDEGSKAGISGVTGSSVDVKKIKDTAWETLDGSVSELDLSWITSRSKISSMIFRFVDPATNKVVMYQKADLPAQESGMKVGLSAVSGGSIDVTKTSQLTITGQTVGDEDAGYLYFYKGKSTLQLVSASSIEWKKGTTGNWTDVSSTAILLKNMQSFKLNGATLYFRIKADSKNWASKEVKYSYKKQANAPKVAVDLNKLTIAFKKGQEYKVIVNNTEYPSKGWIDVDRYTTDKKLSPVLLSNVGKAVSGTGVSGQLGDVIYDIASNVSIKVRTAGTAKGIPSKISTISIKPASLNAITVGTNGSIKVSYTKPYDVNGGITLKNTAGADFEFAVVATGKSVDASTKWAKIAKDKEAKIAGNTDKSVKYKTDSMIYVRSLSNKTNNEIAGKPVKYLISSIPVVTQGAVVAKGTVEGAATVSAITNASGVSNGAVTVDMKATTSGVVSCELDFTFAGLSGTSSSSKAKVDVTGTKPSGVTVPSSMTISNGAGKLKIVGGKDCAAGSFGLKVVVENVTFVVTINVTK